MARWLQCGYPRSGNTLLWNLLYRAQRAEGGFRSFCERSGFGRLMEFYESDKLLHRRHGKIDHFAVRDGQLCFVYPNVDCRHVELDAATFVEASSLLWTHGRPDSFLDQPWLDRVDRMLYVCRDPRPVYVSSCHHVVRPEYLRLLPQMELTTVEQVMDRLDLAEKWARDWSEHVKSFLAHRDRFLLVRFEDLVADKARVVAGLLRELEPGAEEGQIERRTAALLEATGVERMRRESPRHVREGSPGGWRDEIRDEARRIVEETAAEGMRELGYD